MNIFQNKQLLVIGFVWPEPKSSAAGTRMFQLLTFFKDKGAQITFASTASDSEFSTFLEGITYRQIVLNCPSFDSFVLQLQPDLVIFDRFMTEEQFGWRVAEQCPDALRILDSEDLHCLREARRLAVVQHQPFDLVTDLSKREIASIYRCDITLVISEFEMNLLQMHFKVPMFLLFYLPLWVDSFSVALPPFEARKDFVFIGNFLHAPNQDAVVYLKQVIWPLFLSQFPLAVMHVYGAYPSPIIRSLHEPKLHFFVHGRATCALEVISKARVLLAPIRFGAGLKGKLIEAMQYGTPSVTSSCGAEGIPGSFLWPGFVTDNPEEFTLKAIELYQDETIWSQAQETGVTVLASRFSKALFEVPFLEFLQDRLANKLLYRNNNFTGLMLGHHYWQSTKYMAKWIEAKNKEQ